MEKKETNIKITGDVSGQMAVGDNIKQTQIIHPKETQLSGADLEKLNQMLSDLKTKVETEAPDEKKQAALERVNELGEAIAAEEPDLTTMEYVKNWFGKNLPKLAGAVSGLILNPLVGKIVESGGELLAEEFRRRFAKK